MRRPLALLALACVALPSTAADAQPAADAPPAPAPAPPPQPQPTDLVKLRADYDRLRDDLFRARARAQVVEQRLYASRFAATLRWKGAPDFILRRAELRLDGSSIWDSGERPMVDELIKVAERSIKPGPHAVTVRLEVRPGKKNDKETADLGYESEHTFVVNVPDGKQTTVAITGDDDGDPPTYEPAIDFDVASKKIEIETKK